MGAFTSRGLAGGVGTGRVPGPRLPSSAVPLRAPGLGRYLGFQELTPLRSCFWHPYLLVFLDVYVDDFKMAGPSGNLAKAWKLVQEAGPTTPGIEIDPPTAVGRYLGCEHRVTRKTVTWQALDPSVRDAPVEEPPLAAPAAGPAFLTWERVDQGKKCFLTTLATGPKWREVVWRRTINTDTGEVLGDACVLGAPDKELHGPLPGCSLGKGGRTRNTRTTLWYKVEAVAAPAAAAPTTADSYEANALCYDMRDFFRSCVDLYVALTGSNPAHYPSVPTPFCPENVDAEDGIGGPRGVGTEG